MRRIVAPFDGLITEKLVDPGNLVAPGTPLLRMEDTRAFELDVRVDESRAARVATEVRRRRDRRRRRRPDDATPAGSPRSPARSTPTRARCSSPSRCRHHRASSRPACSDARHLPGAPGGSLTVPDGALVRNGQLTSVFVVDDERARLRFVNVGRSADGATEIRAGLSEGESVVVDPPPGLRDGTPVTTPTTRDALACGGRIMTTGTGAAGRLAAAFIRSPLTPLFIGGAIALGALAVAGAAARRRTADRRADDRRLRGDARRLGRRSRATGHPAAGAAAVGDPRRRVPSTPPPRPARRWSSFASTSARTKRTRSSG